MKKLLPYALLLGLLFGCAPRDVDDHSSLGSSGPNSSSAPLSTSISPSEPSTAIEPSSSIVSNPSTSVVDSTPTPVLAKTIGEILALGENLSEGEMGETISFKGMYLKALTHNNDKVMLFADQSDYLYVRVVGGFNDFLKNRYLNCYYNVQGTITKKSGNVEVVYQELTNITSTPESFDYQLISEVMPSLSALYEEIGRMTLDAKYSGIGKVVTVEGRVVATDRSDANSKAFIYDGEKVISIINTSKICDATAIGDHYRFTGCISVLKSSPAIMMMDSELIVDEEQMPFDYTSAQSMMPSDFAKWYYVGDNIRPPLTSDYGTLYKITGYVADDASRLSVYNLGLMDTANGDLSDTGIKTSIKGVYFLNHLSMDERDLSYSVFNEYYISQEEITLYAILYQFDTNNHGWKLVPLESTIQLVRS